MNQMKTNSPTAKWSAVPHQINSVSINDDGSRCVYGSSYERGSGYFYTYLYDGDGNLLWRKPIVCNEQIYQGVFWVAISGDGQYVASGGETADTDPQTEISTPGFLQAFHAGTGEQLINITLSDRINQVSLSQNGQYLAVCYGKNIEVYQLKESLVNPGEFINSYESIYKYTSSNYSINSCVISYDGSTVIASGIAYSDESGKSTNTTNDQTEDTTSGVVLSYTVNNGVVSSLGAHELNTGSMRVAVTEDGKLWAASLHDGSCALFSFDSPDDKTWQCTPPQTNLMLAYALDITQTDQGDVYVACGANLSGVGPGGFLYLVKSAPIEFDDNHCQDGYPSNQKQGIIQWSKELQFGVNPGVTMDKNATFVTATDGKPVGQTIEESAGNFYLFNATTSDLIWQQKTTMMNWPMMLSRDGSSVVGGSDDGSFFYWKTPQT